jgi:hypothetical protein
MKITKFVVKVNRGGTPHLNSCSGLIGLPSRRQPTVKLALVMGRFTPEDAVKSLNNSRRSPELESVQVSA